MSIHVNTRINKVKAVHELDDLGVTPQDLKKKKKNYICILQFITPSPSQVDEAQVDVYMYRYMYTYTLIHRYIYTYYIVLYSSTLNCIRLD